MTDEYLEGIMRRRQDDHGDTALMVKTEQERVDRARIRRAIVAGCTAADVHLECSYPSCRCTQMPRAIEAAIRSYQLTETDPSVRDR